MTSNVCSLASWMSRTQVTGVHTSIGLPHCHQLAAEDSDRSSHSADSRRLVIETSGSAATETGVDVNVLAWVLQGICAVMFVTSGTAKSLMSKERMIETSQTGVAPFPLPLIRIVAVSELFGVAGLILPWATGTAKFLTPVAAGCLIVFMIGAAISHWSLKEYKQALGVNLPLALMLATILVIRVGQL
jgi:uncharacterized membrane protein YphA (DoxX/SURF4 family)